MYDQNGIYAPAPVHAPFQIAPGSTPHQLDALLSMAQQTNNVALYSSILRTVANTYGMAVAEWLRTRHPGDKEILTISAHGHAGAPDYFFFNGEKVSIHLTIKAELK